MSLVKDENCDRGNQSQNESQTDQNNAPSTSLGTLLWSGSGSQFLALIGEESQSPTYFLSVDVSNELDIAERGGVEAEAVGQLLQNEANFKAVCFGAKITAGIQISSTKGLNLCFHFLKLKQPQMKISDCE